MSNNSISVGGNVYGNVSGGDIKYVSVTGDVQTVNMDNMPDEWKSIIEDAKKIYPSVNLEPSLNDIYKISTQEEITEIELTKLEKAVEFLKFHGPDIASTAGEIALSFIPGGTPAYKLIKSVVGSINKNG